MKVGGSMKKAALIAFAVCLCLFLAACSDDYSETYEPYRADEAYEADEVYDAYEAGEVYDADGADEPPEFCDCGSFYADMVVRQDTPPLHIHEFPDDDFMEQFAVRHYVDFADWDTEWRARLVVWTERAITELSFVSLTDHVWVFDILHYPAHARETVFTLDALLPGEALVLDVSFMHYLIPRGMLTFTDYDGTRQSMLITESMAGGCIPWYHLRPFSDPFNIAPHQRVNSAEPTAVQRAIIAEYIGDFEMGEAIRTYYADLESGFAMYARVLRGTKQPAASDTAFMTWGFWPPIEIDSTAGDVVFVFIDIFDVVFALINIEENTHGETIFQRIELDLE